MKDVGGVCMRHPPCAGAFAPEDEDKEKRSFPLWAGQTTFLIVIAEVIPSAPNRLSRSPFRITVRSAVASSCFSSALSFRQGNERNLPKRDGAQRPRALAPWVSLSFNASVARGDKIYTGWFSSRLVALHNDDTPNESKQMFTQRIRRSDGLAVHLRRPCSLCSPHHTTGPL